MILDRIVQAKKEEIAEQKREKPLELLREELPHLPPARDFFAALAAGSDVKVIAEVKQSSPSKGLIRPGFEPVSLAEAYRDGGAAAISVLTDEKFFRGSLSFLAQIRRRVGLPLLRKDFLLDSYQIYQSRAAGADSILLIARILGFEPLREFIGLARELGMEPLVEIHDSEDLSISVAAGARIIGINNRDLATFITDIEATLALAPQVPAGCLSVSESGIGKPEDLQRLGRAGVKAVLVGEALAREQDVTGATQRLVLGGKVDDQSQDMRH